MDYYANAVRAEPGICWRTVPHGPGYRMDSPTDCPERVNWIVGRKRMRLWSCDGHVEGLEEVLAATR